MIPRIIRSRSALVDEDEEVRGSKPPPDTCANASRHRALTGCFRLLGEQAFERRSFAFKETTARRINALEQDLAPSAV